MTHSYPFISMKCLNAMVAVFFLLIGLSACRDEKDKAQKQPADASTKEEMPLSNIPAAERIPLPPNAFSQAQETDAGAVPPSQGVLIGEWPETLPDVTLKAREQSVAEILTALFQQLDYGLAINAPAELTAAKLSLSIAAKPGRDVLEAILEQSSLKAELKRGIAFITPQEGLESAHHGDCTAEFHGGTVIQDGDNKVQFGKSMHIEANEVVGDAVVIGGSLRIDGRVRGDAVAVGGSVTIEQSGIVNGDAAAIGGTVEVKPGGKLDGEKTTVGGLLNLHL